VDGKTGLLVPLGLVDALSATLARLAADATLRARLGAAGLARARELYDEAKVVTRQLALLAALDANRGRD